MLEITPTLAIDESEIREEFVRASGPGGQNVNKVSTAVQLRFNVLTATDGLIELYFKQAWYNVWHIGEQNSRVNRMYINIATPAILQDGVLTWTDLDLDLRVHMDGSLELLDEDEFLENRAVMHYPPAVVAQAYAACDYLKALYARDLYPFTHAEHCALYESIKQKYFC